MKDTDICIWCNNTYGDHVDYRKSGDIVPKVPCALLKSGFALKKYTSPVPKKKAERMFTFGEAMELVKDGKKITKLEWGTNEEYGFLKDGYLMIFRSNKFFIWQVSDGDLLGTDWVIVAEGN